MVTGKNIIGSPLPGFSSEVEGAKGNTGDIPNVQVSPLPESSSAPANQQAGVRSAYSKVNSGTEVPEKDEMMGYDKQIEALEAAAASIKMETPEQRKKRERQERSKKIIGAFTDGLSALSNLFFTTQYAPNSYNPQHSQLGKVSERIEALKAERKADEERYHNLRVRLGDVQNAKAKTLRDIKAQHEAQRLAREAAQREAELHPWAVLTKQHQADKEGALAEKAGYDAESSRLESENKPTELDLKNQYAQAGIDQRKASAGASRASAANSYASANAHNRSHQKEYFGLSKTGKEVSFATEKAAIDFEHRQGTFDPSRWGLNVEEVTTVKGRPETGDGQTNTKKKTYPQKKESPTAGGGGGKKSPTS